MPHVQIADLLGPSPVEWSIAAIDLKSNQAVAEFSSSTILKTASVPKILLLWDLASKLHRGEVREDDPVDRRTTLRVEDSGVWQYLKIDILPLVDAAALVGAFSDNLATNALLDIVGLEAVAEAGGKLGCNHTRLNDFVRSERLPGIHPPAISQGSSEELVKLCARQELLAAKGDPVASRLINWLRRGVDYSMVIRRFGLDPLSHYEAEEGFRVWNKTGTDNGVRADVGVIEGPTGSVAYSVIANWDAETLDNQHVLSTMGEIGGRLRLYCDG